MDRIDTAVGKALGKVGQYFFLSEALMPNYLSYFSGSNLEGGSYSLGHQGGLSGDTN